MMKKSAYYFIVLVTALFVVAAQAQTPVDTVDQWGSIGGRTGGGWRIVTGTPGNAGTVGDSVPSGQWATIRGGFSAPVTATTSEAIIVSGHIEFVGSGPVTWSGLRYGMFWHDSVGTLQYAGTDSAQWSGKESNAYGYMFTPQSGTTYTGNIPGGFNASQGVCVNGNWISSYSGFGFGGLIPQAPARAVFDEGTYDWAMSVQPMGDGTNEVRFYMQKQLEAGATQTTYWYGGSLIDTSSAGTSGVTDTFNGIAFGLDPNFDEETSPIREMNLTDVKVELGDPITLPPVPFEPFYITNWGSIGGRTGGWRIDTTQTIIGNAGIQGDSVPSGNWATIRGGFDEFPVTATEDKAIIISGHVQFVGSGPVTWSGLRYGLFRHDSVGTLLYAGTDSAQYDGKESNAYGYMFTPQSGTTYTGNIPGGFNASQGVSVNGNWISTYSGFGFGGLIPQAPARAVFDEGTYDWAISVQPMGDGTNEVRFYMQKQLDPGATQTTFWYGGTLIDTSSAGMSGVTTTFNGVCFGLDPNYDEETSPIRELNLTDVKVDLGDPITVPDPPFAPFYITNWGSIGGRTGGWQIDTTQTIIGNAGIHGDAVPSGNWATIRGGFDEFPVTATEDKALILTGTIEFVGSGPVTWSGLRYGLFRHDSVGTLQAAGTDSAQYDGKESNAYGYMFTPQSGTTYTGNIPGGTNASQGVTRGGSWISTYGGAVGFGGLIQQAPARAVFDAGTYDWAISVQPLGDGTNEVRFYMIKQLDPGATQTTYWYGGTLIDTSSTGTSGVTTTFNGVCFGLNPNYDEETSPIRELNLRDVKVDLGDPITVPEPPWQLYYIDQWGFLGGRTGGWDFIPDPIIGNTAIGGTAPNTDWAVVRGGFVGKVKPPLDKALQVTGKVIFEGGGFEGFSGLRFGLFYAENPGEIVEDNEDSTTTHWSGTEDQNSGYLFLPPSDDNPMPIWAAIGGTGTWGAVSNTIWLNTNGTHNYVLGDNPQTPENAIAGAGTYDFTIMVQRLQNGGNAIKFSLDKDDGSYSFAGQTIDNHNFIPTNEFNGVIFGLNSWSGSTTTKMQLKDVNVDQVGPLVAIEDPEEELLPKTYSLRQNYPNPFNPTTTIEFALPKSSDISLVVYDVSGRIVKTIATGYYKAGNYKINFNASNLATGMYFYRLKAKDFVSTKKLLLMK